MGPRRRSPLPGERPHRCLAFGTCSCRGARDREPGGVYEDLRKRETPGPSLGQTQFLGGTYAGTFTVLKVVHLHKLKRQPFGSGSYRILSSLCHVKELSLRASSSVVCPRAACWKGARQNANSSHVAPRPSTLAMIEARGLTRPTWGALWVPAGYPSG